MHTHSVGIAVLENFATTLTVKSLLTLDNSYSK
jgi:hypothetical protein